MDCKWFQDQWVNFGRSTYAAKPAHFAGMQKWDTATCGRGPNHRHLVNLICLDDRQLSPLGIGPSEFSYPLSPYLAMSWSNRLSSFASIR